MPKHSAFRRAAAMMIIVMLLCALFPASIAENVSVRSAPLVNRSGAVNGMVRVYLSSLGSPSKLNLKVQGAYSVSVTGQHLSSGSSVTVQIDSSTGALLLTCNGQTTNMGSSFSLRRQSSGETSGVYISQARESGNLYPGDISFKAVSGSSGYTLYTVAHIYIENYLYGVLPYEMGNSTSIEALKAQAVAARTYTVRMMQDRASGLYDVKDTTSDQVYRGTPSGNANCVSAVNATKGVVLMYDFNYITTYYSASNGGQTEIPRTGKGLAYLTVKDDPFDYANTSSTVKKKTIQADLTSTANPSALISLLKNKAVAKLQQNGYAATSSNTVLQTLKSVTPHTPKYASPSRLYTKMDFTMDVLTQNAYGGQTSAAVTVTCDIFDELESNLSMSIQSSKNELWSVSQKSGSFVLEARRYGHGMGMSQRGAMYMAKQGYTYDQILGFYYEGCQRVKHSFTQSILSASGDEQITVETPVEDDKTDEVACRGRISLPSSGAVLAIRAAASNTAALIGTAANGATVEVLYTGGGWCQIRFGSLVGYVPSDSLSLTGTPPQTEMAVSNVAGFATVTASDFVNLRADGSMSAKVVGTAPAGAVLTVFSTNGSWAKVQYNALTAYANTNFLSAVSQSYPSGNVSAGTSTAYVHTEDGGMLPVRESASMDGAVLMQLADGTAVTVLSDDGSWSWIRYGEQTGYVLSASLSSSSDDTIAPTPTPVPSEEPTGMTGIVTTESGSLNLRAQPMAGSRILTTIPRLAQVEITEMGDSWCGVRYNGYTGYAMTRFLTISGAPETTAPPASAEGVFARVVTPSGTLNLREAPRSGSPILTTIQPGETVTVWEKGAEWCRVQYGQLDGYVMTVFLSFQQAEETPQPSDEPTPTPEQTEGTSSPEPTPEATPQPHAVYAMVSTASGSLNLRQEAQAGSAVLAQIPRGETLLIEERLTYWSRTTYRGITGYVMNSYLRFQQEEQPEEPKEETTPAPSSGTAIVTTSSGTLNLRAEPYSGAQVLRQLPRGATVKVLSRQNDWTCISYNDLTGYVMTRYLTFGAEETQPAPTPEPSTEAIPSPAPPGGEARTAYVDTATGGLNLRQSPGGTVLANIPQGWQLSVIPHDDTWAYTAYNGQEGYVMLRYLRWDQPTDPLPEEDNGTPDEEQAVDVWVQTSGGDLNLRREPNEQADVLQALTYGTKLKLLEEGNTWSLVSCSGVQGYVMTRYLSVHQPKATPEPEKTPSLSAPENGPLYAVVLGGEAMSLWPTCKEGGNALGTLAPGEQVQVLLQGDGWCCVQSESLQGYCLMEHLQMVNE